jgi:hypothetical protein
MKMKKGGRRSPNPNRKVIKKAVKVIIEENN